MAHALGKSCVLLTRDIDEVPFDLRPYRVNTYSTHFLCAEELRNTLCRVASGCASGEIAFGGPVTDFIPTSVVQAGAWSPDAPEDAPPARVPDEPDVEPGILDAAMEAEHAMASATEVISAIGASTDELNTSSAVLIEEITELAQSNAPGRAGQLHGRVAQLAELLSGWASHAVQVLPQLSGIWESMYASTAQIVTQGRVSDEDDLRTLASLEAALREFVDGEADRLDGPRALLNSLPAMKGVSRDMTRAATRAERAVLAFIEQMEAGQAHVSRLLNLVEDRLRAEATG